MPPNSLTVWTCIFPLCSDQHTMTSAPRLPRVFTSSIGAFPIVLFEQLVSPCPHCGVRPSLNDDMLQIFYRIAEDADIQGHNDASSDGTAEKKHFDE